MIGASHLLLAPPLAAEIAHSPEPAKNLCARFDPNQTFAGADLLTCVRMLLIHLGQIGDNPYSPQMETRARVKGILAFLSLGRRFAA
jgi:hypothetical protein